MRSDVNILDLFTLFGNYKSLVGCNTSVNIDLISCIHAPFPVLYLLGPLWCIYVSCYINI